MIYNHNETRNTEHAVKAVQARLDQQAAELQESISDRRKSHGKTIPLMRRLNAVRHRQLELDNGASPWPELGRA